MRANLYALLYKKGKLLPVHYGFYRIHLLVVPTVELPYQIGGHKDYGVSL